MLEISPLRPIDLNNKMVYIYELKFSVHIPKTGICPQVGKASVKPVYLRRLQCVQLLCLLLYLLHAKADNPHSHRKAASSFQNYIHPHLIPANEMILSQ